MGLATEAKVLPAIYHPIENKKDKQNIAQLLYLADNSFVYAITITITIGWKDQSAKATIS